MINKLRVNGHSGMLKGENHGLSSHLKGASFLTVLAKRFSVLVKTSLIFKVDMAQLQHLPRLPAERNAGMPEPS